MVRTPFSLQAGCPVWFAQSGDHVWTGVASGSLYFVVVGTDDTGVYESSWGRDSSGSQRHGTTTWFSKDCGSLPRLMTSLLSRVSAHSTGLGTESTATGIESLCEVALRYSESIHQVQSARSLRARQAARRWSGPLCDRAHIDNADLVVTKPAPAGSTRPSDGGAA